MCRHRNCVTKTYLCPKKASASDQNGERVAETQFERPKKNFKFLYCLPCLVEYFYFKHLYSPFTASCGRRMYMYVCMYINYARLLSILWIRCTMHIQIW